MSIEITVEGRIAGQRRSLFADWHIELPPMEERRGNHLKLRDLITTIVLKEVDAFKTRQEERRLARVMSKKEIDAGVLQGKVEPGERDLQQEVDSNEAITVALQAFEDGLYFVFVDEVQQMKLDDEVFIKSKSKVMFLRLTALVGG